MSLPHTYSGEIRTLIDILINKSEKSDCRQILRTTLREQVTKLEATYKLFRGGRAFWKRGKYHGMDDAGTRTYDVEHLVNGTKNSMKAYRSDIISVKLQDKIINECTMFQKLRHPNVSVVLDFFDDNINGVEYFSVVQEEAKKNLYTNLKRRQTLKDYFNEKDLIKMFVEVCIGLKKIHS